MIREGKGTFAVMSQIKNDTDRTKAAAIFDMYYGTMMYTAKSILKDKATAEDAVSDSVIKIIKNLDKITDISSPKTRAYIVIIVRTTALNLLKKHKNLREDIEDDLGEIPDNDLSILEQLTTDESCEFINSAITSLPKTLSDVLRMSIVYEYDNKKIAKLFNISYDLVRQRLSRAKKVVRKILCEAGEVDGRQKRKNL